ncbi:MAG: hypothetical protein LBD85_05170 [Oscillospiraceae bacterium]|jgi:hypothetical protein|nr:hypothetical protein [Oscillospiraceae bacterium]
MKTYEDVFVEEMTLLRRDGASALMKAAIVFGALVIIAVLYIFLRPFNIPFSAVVVYFAVLGWHYTRVEYEYSFAGTSFTDGELDVIKIMGKRKRKNMVNIKMKSVTEFIPLRGEHISDSRTLRATGIPRNGGDDRLLRYDGGVLLFTPSARMTEAITKFLPRGAIRQ